MVGAWLPVALLAAYQVVRLLRVAWMRHITGKPCAPQGFLCGWAVDYTEHDLASSRLLRQKSVLPNYAYPYFFGGAYESNILASTGAEWLRQRAMIHPLIVQRSARFAELARETPLRLPLGRGVWLPRAIGEHAANISAAALGTACPVDVVSIWYRVAVLCILTSTIADCWRPLGRLLLRHTALDQQLRAFVQRSADPEVREVRDACGLLGTLGHLWAISLGSTIPETSVVCDILEELAAHTSLQSSVRGWIREGGKDDPRFLEWIQGRCHRYVFFWTSKPRDDGGAAAVVSLDSVGAPFGLGQRRCPGARIGMRTVSLIVAAVLLDHELSLARAPCLRRQTLGIHHLFRPCLVSITAASST